MGQQAIALSPDKVKAAFLSAEDLKVAASILYNAYFDDPLFVDIFESEKEGYQNRLRSAIREELHAFWIAKQPIVGLFDQDRLLSVACLISPDAAFGAGRYWHWRLKMLLTAGFFGTKQMIDKRISLLKKHEPDILNKLLEIKDYKIIYKNQKYDMVSIK